MMFFSKNFHLGSNQVNESTIFGPDQGLGQLGLGNLITNVLEFTLVFNIYSDSKG